MKSKLIAITGPKHEELGKAFVEAGISHVRIKPTTPIIRFLEKTTGRHLRTSENLEPPVTLNTKNLRDLKWFLLDQQPENGIPYRVDALTSDLVDVAFTSMEKLISELTNTIRALHPQAVVEMMLTPANLDANYKGYVKTYIFVDGDFTTAEQEYLYHQGASIIHTRDDVTIEGITKSGLYQLIGETPPTETKDDETKQPKKGKK